MSKYHINGQTGKPGKCSAKPGNCPLGGEGEHFESEAEARLNYEVVMAGQTVPRPAREASFPTPTARRPALQKEGVGVELEDARGEVLAQERLLRTAEEQLAEADSGTVSETRALQRLALRRELLAEARAAQAVAREEQARVQLARRDEVAKQSLLLQDLAPHYGSPGDRAAVASAASALRSIATEEDWASEAGAQRAMARLRQLGDMLELSGREGIMAGEEAQGTWAAIGAIDNLMEGSAAWRSS